MILFQIEFTIAHKVDQVAKTWKVIPLAVFSLSSLLVKGLHGLPQPPSQTIINEGIPKNLLQRILDLHPSLRDITSAYGEIIMKAGLIHSSLWLYTELNYEIACHRISLTLPCQTCLTGFLAKMVTNSRWSRSYFQTTVLMTKRDNILAFCRQKAPQLTWLSLEIADVRPTPSVCVSNLQKERRCPRGILLYCACSPRTWPAATAVPLTAQPWWTSNR